MRQIKKAVKIPASGKKPDKAPSADSTLPIVGIGASAGGLEALELFLANVPAGSGMAFVIVQHLDPTHKGVMVELLQRGTAMRVFQIKDRMRVEANCVYVIPPNKDISILNGTLYLLDPVEKHGLRLPIDFFFRALADDQKEHSIGVILSGMGSDGTLGLRAIKEKAGVVFVQDPKSAKFNGMPRSAADAGLADVIAPADELPGRIVSYLSHVPLLTNSSLSEDSKTHSAVEKIIIVLRGQTGHDFSLYKQTTIRRRIERRMGLHQIKKIADYVRFLQENPHETELLFRELLIGVTNFFRDPEAWEQLQAEGIPALLTERASNRALRGWIPACSTGEEAYSLAILFKEALEKIKPAGHITVQLFATDLDRQAIEKARAGIFPANIVADVPPNRLERFFVKTARGYQVAKPIREMVVFAPQNLIMDPPFTKLDIICCRNLLIYLTPELQKKLLPLFHYSLNPGGLLFLGSAETVGTFTNLFSPLAGKNRIYKRLTLPLTGEPIELPASFVTARHRAADKTSSPPANLSTFAEQLLLQKYSPAAVLTNDQGDILYTSGRTGKYLEPAAGRANWNIFAMAREGLDYELAGAFQKALRERETIEVKNLEVGTDGGRQVLNLTVQPLFDGNDRQGMVMIVFHEVALKPKSKRTVKTSRPTVRAAELEQELEIARHEVQTIREEMQSSHEELKSANEEMQSTNEELQSTNEELTTSKEELQSMNEEMQTVNLELQTRLDELVRTNNDMKNLLDSTDIATLFLDNDLCVRRFTSETSKITQLIPTDVGRPITDIASALLYAGLVQDARDVLRTLTKADRQISMPDGNWFAVRILPYRTLENRIDGVVITFMEITAFKKLEADLKSRSDG